MLHKLCDACLVNWNFIHYVALIKPSSPMDEVMSKSSILIATPFS